MPVIGEEITRGQTEQEQEVLDGLDFEIMCERPSRPEHSAHFALFCKRCGAVVYLCGSHLAEIRMLLAKYPWPRSGVGCDSCRSKAPSIEDLYRVVPL